MIFVINVTVSFFMVATYFKKPEINVQANQILHILDNTVKKEEQIIGDMFAIRHIRHNSL